MPSLSGACWRSGAASRTVPGDQFPVPDHDVDPFADRTAGGRQPQFRGGGHRRHSGRHRIRRVRKDDAEFTALFDQQLADEMQHVRFANVWIKKMHRTRRCTRHDGAGASDDARQRRVKGNRRRRRSSSIRCPMNCAARLDSPTTKFKPRANSPIRNNGPGGHVRVAVRRRDRWRRRPLEARAAGVRDVLHRDQHAAGDRAGATGYCDMRG